ncbi:MAG: 50S ribosomal protein L9 [Bacteroidales bacterium]|jgi:large subunit ribosomal protein L9|nr:50S ribosomal protein L9 [Bacteroidales bacterium]
MKIILKKEVAGLGEALDVVEVKAGYALNYLVPQGFAIVGTPSAIKQNEETIRQRAHKEAKLVADAQAVAAKAEAVAIKIAAKVGEGGKLYGGITAAQVAEALAAAGIEVEKRNIEVPEIKALGKFEAKAKFYKGVYATLKIEVVEAE